MEKQLDLRIQKTYIALISSFRALLKQKHFENITVNEICDNAMVRRATFYKHFGDKYEFFTFMVRSIMEESFHRDFQINEVENDPLAPYYCLVKNVLRILDENDALVQSVIQSDMFPVLLNIISEQIVLDVKAYFVEDKRNGKDLLLPPELFAEAFSGALINISRWWIKNKNAVGKDELLQHISVMMKKLYY